MSVNLTHDELLIMLGQAKAKWRTGRRLVKIWRLTSLSLQIWPSVWPLDHAETIAASTACLSLMMPFANEAMRLPVARASQASRSEIAFRRMFD
jgi:hypothetical protein